MLLGPGSAGRPGMGTPSWLRRPDSDEVSDWLRGSAAGCCMFHRTADDFAEFDTTRGDLGSHFGPLSLVNQLPRYDLSGGECVTGDRIIPVWLRIFNPLRLRDVGSFHADGIVLQLARKGLLPIKAAKEIHAECDADWRLRKGNDDRLRRLIRAEGFYGVQYLSKWDRVAGECFIAFDADQICPALPYRAQPECVSDWLRPRCI